MNGYFGVRWDAPAFDDAKQFPCPAGEKCILCGQVVIEGESGVMMAFVNEQGESGTAPQHIECFLRTVFGSVDHLEQRCSCYRPVEAGTRVQNFRAQARETMEWLVLHGH